jgi:hypothetical protein
MMRLFSILLLILWLPAAHAGDTLPRTVLTFYDSQVNPEIAFSNAHQFAEMPLNHLGLILRYLDIRQPLPDLDRMPEVRGILLWFEQNSLPDATGFLNWCIRALRAGKRIVILGDHAFEREETGKPVPRPVLDRFWRELGLQQENDWVSATYDTRFITHGDDMLGYERDLQGIMPAYGVMKLRDAAARSHLIAERPGPQPVRSHLVATTPRGGYVAPGYAYFSNPTLSQRLWYINPFLFFRTAFDTGDLPKPDTTTVSGERIYYSHIDGDGWRNLSLIEGYYERGAYSSEVVLKEVLIPYDDLPVTVGPIAAELDPELFGDKDTMRIAREIFLLPHVEAGSHTYTHPLEWVFFKDAPPDKERPFLARYPRPKGRIGRLIENLLKREGGDRPAAPDSARASGKGPAYRISDHYEAPRVFYAGPFSVQQEVQGAVEVIQRFLPPGKRVEILQWSGNTQPFAEVLAATARAGLRNINGGDTRFDRDYDSVAWVSPLGRQVGEWFQPYASNSNENTYTDLWTDRFFGFQHLVQTLHNTEVPYRLKPINIYYHMYSGERLASLNALRKNLNFARTQAIAPVSTSHFSAIADGFMSTRIESLGEQRWRIHDRGALQTLRFDRATFRGVDFQRSEGVIGQRHLHGSLYVHLDASHPAPLVALKEIRHADREPPSKRPYLIRARWRVRNWQELDDGFAVEVEGFGAGEMLWQMPHPGRYRIETGRHPAWSVETAPDGTLSIRLPEGPIQPLTVRVHGPEAA